MITLFTTCKPFLGDTSWRQMNALKSWSFLGLPVLIIGDDEGAEGAAAKFGYRFIPDIRRSSKGAPYLDSLFEIAESVANTDTVAYVNADIILIDGWAQAVSGRKGLIVGLCYEIEQDGPIIFDTNWVKRIKSRSCLRSRWARDYFVFQKGLWDFVPPFEVGMFAWDTWLRTHAPRKACLNKRDNFHQKHKQVPSESLMRNYNKKLEERYR